DDLKSLQSPGVADDVSEGIVRHGQAAGVPTHRRAIVGGVASLNRRDLEGGPLGRHHEARGTKQGGDKGSCHSPYYAYEGKRLASLRRPARPSPRPRRRPWRDRPGV